MGSERTVQETLPLLSNSRGRFATVSTSARRRKSARSSRLRTLFKVARHLKSKKLPPQQSS